MKLFIARHAVTEMNKAEQVNGLIDEPLSLEGIIQSKQLAERLKDSNIEAIYSSPLIRATQTAQPLADSINVPIKKDRRLTEVDFGKLSGKTQSEIVKLVGKTMVEQLNSYEYDLSSFDGESVDQVRARVSAVLNEIKKSGNKTVLIIAHGGIIRMIYFLCTGQKMGLPSNAQEIELEL